MLAVAKGRERLSAVARVQREAFYRAISSRNETQVQLMESHPHQRRGRRGWKAVKPSAEQQDGALNTSLCLRWNVITYYLLAPCGVHKQSPKVSSPPGYTSLHGTSSALP